MQLNTIEKSDILSRDEYKSKRKSLREKMVLRKKFRRVDIGPYVTMYFENKDTIIHQINEMVYIENGGEEQINDEILAYKSLIPDGQELVATVMIEIDNPIKRAEFLSKMGGFEETINIKIHDQEIKGKAELDGDRTTADGKASSVQFVHFEFDEKAVKSIKNNTTVESYETKDKHIMKVGDTLTIGTAYNKKGRNILGDLFSNIATGNIKGTTKEPDYLPHSYNGQKVIIESIYVMHEKYNGYNPLYNRKEMPLYILVYAKRPKVQNVNIKNISTALSHKRITIVDIEKAFSFGEVINPVKKLNREEAIKKLKEAKDLFELDLMSKSEYEKLRLELTPIITNKN